MCVYYMWIFPPRLYHLSFNLIYSIFFYSVHKFEYLIQMSLDMNIITLYYFFFLQCRLVSI